jgi:hypothetical protein
MKNGTFLKRSAGVLLLAFALCYVNIAAAQRIALVEHFTGENCGPCAIKNPAFEALLSSGTNPSKLAHITWMVDIPTAGYFHNTSKKMIQYRIYNYYFNVFGGTYMAPSCFIGGYRSSPGSPVPSALNYFDQHDIDSEIAVPPAFKIDASHKFNSNKDSVTVTIKVDCIADYAGTASLFVAWVKNMEFSKSPGTNGEKKFYHVVRDLFPSPAGGPAIGNYATALTAMPPPSGSMWKSGQSQTYIVRGKVTGLDSFTNVISDDSTAVVWIQNNTNYRVEQAAKSTTGTTGISSIHAAEAFIIYPNPAGDVMYVQMPFAKADYALYDLTGKIILSGIVDTPGTINTGSLSSGQYLLEIKSNGEALRKMVSVSK